MAFHTPGDLVRVVDYNGNTDCPKPFTTVRSRIGVAMGERRAGRVYVHITFGDDLEPGDCWLPWQNLKRIGNIFEEGQDGAA